VIYLLAYVVLIMTFAAYWFITAALVTRKQLRYMNGWFHLSVCLVTAYCVKV